MNAIHNFLFFISKTQILYIIYNLLYDFRLKINNAIRDFFSIKGVTMEHFF